MISVSDDVLSAAIKRLHQGVTSAQELGRLLRRSQSTISKALRRLEQSGRVVRIGATRGARYGLARRAPPATSSWPLYQIDEQGRPQELGTLHALARGEHLVKASLERLQGLSQGLPYFLEGSRPAGFLGRGIPVVHRGLELPEHVEEWRDDHVLTYLTQLGSATPGDLILGNDALNRHVQKKDALGVTPGSRRPVAYTTWALLDSALALNPPLQGEQPKFTALISEGPEQLHVLVKFSPPVDSEAGRRWADLLIAEHIAHQVLPEHGIRACTSSILEYGNRVFLECERFDRLPGGGRRGVVTLFALDCARYGKLDNWTACAQRLARDGLLSQTTVRQIAFLDAFGALIANTDRHFRNLGFFDRYEGPLELAPVYDMLPMMLAPRTARVMLAAEEPRPVEPQPDWMPVWAKAYEAAEIYLQRLLADHRLSAPFRDQILAHLKGIRSMPSAMRS